MKVGRFDLVEIDGSFAPDNGVYWNTSTNRVEAWKNKQLEGFSDKDVFNVEDWIDWMQGLVKLP
jgi:hypothetical protein